MHIYVCVCVYAYIYTTVSLSDPLASSRNNLTGTPTGGVNGAVNCASAAPFIFKVDI